MEKSALVSVELMVRMTDLDDLPACLCVSIVLTSDTLLRR